MTRKRSSIAFALCAALAIPRAAQVSAALAPEDAAAVRRAMDPDLAVDVRASIDGLVLELGRRDPELSARVDRELAADPALRHDVAALLTFHALGERERAGPLTVSWLPHRLDDEAKPHGRPTPEDLAALAAHVERVASELGLPRPAGAHYRIDVEARRSQCFGTDHPAWGVVSRSPRDLEAAALLVLECGSDVAFLVQPLAALLALDGAPDAREALLAQARRVVLEAGHVPLVEGLRLDHVSTVDDPAFASAVLALDRVERTGGRDAIGRLLRELAGADSGVARADAVRRAVGASPASLDRAVKAEVRRSARRPVPEPSAGRPPGR